VQHGKQGMRLSGNFTKNEKEEEVTFILRENNKKELLVNKESYKKISDHIGKFPCVMIAPDDIELIAGPGEERRKFIDSILSQTNKDYLLQLIAYNKILQQRNSLLKQMAENPLAGNDLLEVYNDQLINSGNYIHQIRKKFLTAFLPLVGENYSNIAGKQEDLQLAYESQLLSNSFKEILAENLMKDKVLQRTSRGVHRDDMGIYLNDCPFKSEASQGQRKSLLFALKLAEWAYLKNTIDIPPILLLDDVFEKLDESRMAHLLEQVCSNEFGQVFITDTHADRIKAKLDETGSPYQLILL
jgi:DNA replication and repair protein RecF